jgi:hypothetical protein
MATVYTAGNPPTRCPNGHPLVGGQVVVNYVRCKCDNAPYRGHRYWTCRVCGERIIGDGHTDDSKMDVLPPPDALLLGED